MKQLRYSTSGNWFKGNTHIHSDESDGAKSFPEIAELYASADYDFLFRTDHWVCSDVASDSTEYPLLWIDGIELDGKDESGAWYHIVCLGKVSGLKREDGLDAALKSAKAQGALTIMAHPHWCANSLEDGLRQDFDGIEIYNHVCRLLNGKENGIVHWDAAIMRDTSVLAFASDDAHLREGHAGWNGGWIVVNAPELTAEAILANIRTGNYYSSCGPDFRSIRLDGDELKIETSPIKFARLVGPGPNGKRQGSSEVEPFEQFQFPVPNDWKYTYIEIEDANGRKAWTNCLFVSD